MIRRAPRSLKQDGGASRTKARRPPRRAVEERWARLVSNQRPLACEAAASAEVSREEPVRSRREGPEGVTAYGCSRLA